ncbi:MAG: hypothetical protein R2941_07885 [Desulfobacterales bacterium]
MRHTLKLDLPEDAYILLMKLSQQIGQLPEVLATKWIISEAQKQIDDPMEKFIGKFSISDNDWADNHDRYIGEKINEKMKAE